ncbi:MAG: hypothetical protein QXO17_06745 [Nitrososphaerota archaeon]|nr:hypothetical protein [Candidatus Calditenuis fumarioli]
MSKAAKKEVREKTIRGIDLPPMKEIEAYLKTQSYVTPSMLAEKFKVRLSVAKDVLSQLASQGLLRLVDGTNRLRIYAVVGGKAPTGIQVSSSSAASEAEVAESAEPKAKKKGRKAAKK